MARKHSRAAAWLAANDKPQGVSSSGLARAGKESTRTVTAIRTEQEAEKLLAKVEKLQRRYHRFKTAGDHVKARKEWDRLQRTKARYIDASRAFYAGRVWRHRKAGGVIHNLVKD